jgi:cyanate lyase
MTNVLELSDRLIEHGITRIQIAKTAGRSLGHVCMVLNGQRQMSKYLAEVIADLMEEVEREININSCVP